MHAYNCCLITNELLPALHVHAYFVGRYLFVQVGGAANRRGANRFGVDTRCTRLILLSPAIARTGAAERTALYNIEFHAVITITIINRTASNRNK